MQQKESTYKHTVIRVCQGPKINPILSTGNTIQLFCAQTPVMILREQTYGCHGGEKWGREGWKTRISGHELLYIEWINNKILLYSTGNMDGPRDYYIK